MQKVKLFKTLESELGQLEAEINDWISQSGASIISMTGNIAPQTDGKSQLGTFSASDVLVVVLYEVPDA